MSELEKKELTHKEKVARYEKNKRHNFISSSRLDGIEIEEKESSLTLEEIITKHTRGKEYV